jgi:hypothetical protein
MRLLTLIIVCQLLTACSASGQLYNPEIRDNSIEPRLVVYRTSVVGGKSGIWVPMRIEVNDREVDRLPNDAFTIMNAPAGEVILSATPMINFQYSSENRVTLKTKIEKGETAYFWLVTVYGPRCTAIIKYGFNEEPASNTHNPRSDSKQSTCLGRVSEEFALKTLTSLRRAH